ncbi:hypothetical protein [Saccharibacillus sp. JS10]|uniref:hypothetical protein n=1 Tax=Saccharibacillus sp. JS10 TaxID=2950552 RepID=UPI002109054F|nr:hypothetical protein [Saccharibacillus sp. JS10]MCQ4086526.1 hypothetical protein [Saccharibacillus sp. JS10]
MYNPTSTDYYSGKKPWIRDKKKFRLAAIMTIVLILISIQYPGSRPLYEEAIRALRIPTSIPLPGGGQFTYPGLIFLGFALWTLFLIWESLNRYRLILSIALIWLSPMIGKAVLAGYQMVIPGNVYAVNLVQDQTNCTYQYDAENMTGTCSIVLSNRSNRELTLEQQGTMILGSGEGRQEINFSLGSVTMAPREAMYHSPTFEVPTPEIIKMAKNDTQVTGSGYTTLSNNGFLLKLDDGKHSRTFGK